MFEIDMFHLHYIAVHIVSWFSKK